VRGRRWEVGRGWQEGGDENKKGEVGGKEVGRRGKFWAEKRWKETILASKEDVCLVHPQNGFNKLILNWCIGGCWFTPIVKSRDMPLTTLY
jgi:hypothetical protein